MSCKTNITYQEFREKAENKELIFLPDSKTTPEEISQWLSKTNEFTELRDADYWIKDLEGQKGVLLTTAENRISKLKNQAYKRYKHIDKYGGKENIYSEGGTYIHTLLEVGMEPLIEAYYNNTSMEAAYGKARAAMKQEKGFAISDDSREKLFMTVKGVFDRIVAEQNKIDNTKKAIFHLENTVTAPNLLRNNTGTLDVLAIFSDKSYAHFDYKSTVPPLGRKARKTVGGKSVDVFTQVPFEGVKLEGQRLPMLRYREILRNNYGLKQARISELVPVVVNYKYDSTKKQLVNEITYIDTVYTANTALEKEVLETIPITFMETGNPKVDSAIKMKEALIEKYKNLQKKYSRDTPEFQSYDFKIKKLRKSINVIYKGFNLDMYFAEIQTLLNLVYKENRNVFEAKPGDQDFISPEDLQELALEVDLYLNTIASETADEIETYKDTDLEKYKEYKEKLDLYLGKLTLLKNKADEAIINSAELIVQEAGTKGTVSEEMGILKKYFTRFSDFDNQYYKAASELIQRAFFKKNQAYQNLQEELQVIQEDIVSKSKGGMTLNEANKALINEQKGELVRPYSDEFLQLLKDSSKNNEDAQFIFKQTYFNPKNNWEEIYTKNRESWIKNNKRFFVPIEGFKTQEEADKEFQAALSNWELNNNLFINGAKNKTAWLNEYSGTYLELNYDQIRRDGYINKKWDAVQNNQYLKRYYDWTVSKNRNFREILGLEWSQLSDYFIPEIRKSTADIAFDKSIALKDKLRIWKEELKSMGTMREDDTFNGERDPETGKPVLTIPKWFIAPLRNEKGEIDPSLKSFDIGKTMMMFGDMAYNYQSMQEIESKILTLKNALLLMPQTQTKNRKTLLGKLGQELEKTVMKGDDVYEVFEDITNSFLYGTAIAGEDNIFEIGGRKISLEKTLFGMNNYYVSKSLGLNPKVALASYLAPRMLMGSHAVKGLAFNVAQNKKTAGILSKYRIGKVFKGFESEAKAIVTMMKVFQTNSEDHNMLEARKFSDSLANKHLNSDLLFSMMRTAETAIDTYITVAMSQNYGYDENGNFSKLFDNSGNPLPGKEGFTSIFDLLSKDFEKGREFINGLKPEQLLKFRQAVQEQGKKVKGTMTYDDKAWFQTQILARLLMTFKTWMPGIIGDRFGKLKYNEKLQGLDWGRYSSILSTNSYLEGDTVSGFLKEVLLPNLGKFIADVGTFGYLGNLQNKGKFSLVNEMRLKKIYSLKRASGEIGEEVTFEEFKNLVIHNQRATATELRLVLGLALLIFAMGSIDGDDDEPLYKDSWAGRNFYRILSRVYTELAFMYSPEEQLRVLGSSIPMLGIYKDLKALFENTLDEIGDIIEPGKREGLLALLFGENKRESQDKTPIGYRAAKMVKGVNAVTELIEFFEIQKEKER